MFRRVAAVVALVVLVSCKEKTTEPVISAAGAWTGSTAITGSAYQFAATLTDNGGTLAGNGTIVGGGANRAMTNSGTRSGGNVSMIWSTPGFNPVNYSATLSGNNKMVGTLNGSGFNGEAMTMNKN